MSDTTASLEDASIRMGAEGVDVSSIVAQIRARVAAKTAAGVYTDARIARAEHTNLLNLTREEEFLSFYLECLREAVFVDINDFDIQERRAVFAPILVGFKRLVWKLLKFYTYRLWSQQNQVNGLLLSSVEGLETRYRDKIRELEERLARLEARGS